MRILFGIMSSILNPAALSLLRDYFPEKERGKANAIFY
jgi:MFS family permease